MISTQNHSRAVALIAVAFWCAWKGLCPPPVVAQNEDQHGWVMPETKNYNPEAFDLAPPVDGSLEGERGMVEVLSALRGQLAHAFYLYRPDRRLPFDNTGDSTYDSYLALHRLVEEANQAETLTFPTRVPAIVPGERQVYARGQIWYPRFSPDGRYLLFRYGTPTDPLSPQVLYVLDIQTRRIWRVPAPPRYSVSYQHISWSPDGRYIAFVIGGNRYGEVRVIQGPDENYIGPMKLYISDWRTGQLQEVASNDTLRGPFRWAALDTLVYGLMPSLDATAPANTRQRPRLYQYSPQTRTSRPVMHDGFLPTPSPSGRWVAFFGAESQDAAALSLREDWMDRPSNMALMVAALPEPTSEVPHGHLSERPWGTSDRIVINNEQYEFPEVFWLPDEKHLITLKQTQWGRREVATNTFRQLNKAEVRLWDLGDALAGTGNARFKVLATLEAEDFVRAPRSPADGAFRGLHVSRDGKTFYATTDEFTGMDPLNKVLYLNRTTLKAIDIASGQVTDIARTTGAEGIDWKEIP